VLDPAQFTALDKARCADEGLRRITDSYERHERDAGATKKPRGPERLP
jgi:hypothetical protein